LNKIDNDLSNKPKRLNKMFNSIMALFLVKLLVNFLKLSFISEKCVITEIEWFHLIHELWITEK